MGFGVPSAMVKFTSENKLNKVELSKWLSNGLILSFLLGMVGSFFLFFMAEKLSYFFDMPSLATLLKDFSLIFPFSIMFTLFMSYLNGLRKMKEHAFLFAIRSFFGLIFVVFFLFLGFNVVGAVIGHVISIVVGALIAYFVVKKTTDLHLSFSFAKAKELSRFGSQLMMSEAINIVNYQADVLMIGYFLTASDVGQYTVAIALSRFFWILPQSIQKIVYPATAEYWARQDISSLNKMVDKSIKYSTSIMVFAGLAVGFYSQEVVNVLFGQGFNDAVLSLQILLIGTVINGSTTRPISGSFAGAGFPKYEMLKSTIAAIVNIILNYFLIPMYGIMGGAIATTVSLILSSIIGLFLMTKKLNLKIDLIWLSKTLFISLFMIFLFQKLHTYSFITGFIILFIYLFIQFTYMLSRDDLVYFKAYLPKLK
jgi:O-antigen/teichoic acid export membrane protein